MSFPYTTTAPPPTNGSLPMVDSANLSSGPYGGGSGPGPSTIGPNPSFSSITIGGANGNIQMNNLDSTLNGNTSIVFPRDSANTTGEAVYLLIEQATSTLSVIYGGGFGALQMNTLILNSQPYNPVNPSTLSLQTDQFGDLTVNMPVGGSLNVSGRNINCSTINVSSINGAQPGGATSIPPAGISTNQVALASGATLSLAADAANIITIDNVKNNITLLPDSGAGTINLKAYSTIVDYDLNVSSINGQAPGGAGTGPDPSFSSMSLSTGFIMTVAGGFAIQDPATGNVNDIYLTTGAPAATFYPAGGDINFIECLSPGGSGTNIALAGSDNGGGYLIAVDAQSGALSSMSLFASGVYISSLYVSSINNATPSGGSALQFSTLGIPGGSGISSFVLSAGTTNNLVEFSTIAGHIYQASVVARASSGPVADSDSIVSEVVDSVAGNEIIASWPLSQVSTLSGSSFLQQVGGSITWKAGGTGAFFSLYPTAAASARVDGINLIDFGAI